MTGSSLAPLIIPIAGTLGLTAWLTLVFYAARRPWGGAAIRRPAAKVPARPRWLPRACQVPLRRIWLARHTPAIPGQGGKRGLGVIFSRCSDGV